MKELGQLGLNLGISIYLNVVFPAWWLWDRQIYTPDQSSQSLTLERERERERERHKIHHFSWLSLDVTSTVLFSLNCGAEHIIAFSKNIIYLHVLAMLFNNWSKLIWILWKTMKQNWPPFKNMYMCIRGSLLFSLWIYLKFHIIQNLKY